MRKRERERKRERKRERETERERDRKIRLEGVQILCISAFREYTTYVNESWHTCE